MTDDERSSDARAEAIAERAALVAIRKTLFMLGVDIDNVENVGKFQRDLAFVRAQRESREMHGARIVDMLIDKAITAAIAAATALLTMIAAHKP